MPNYSNLILSPDPLKNTFEPHALPSESLVSSKVEADPLKFYNIKVVQFWRGEKEHLRPYPLHWAICVEISPGIGNAYQLVGNQTNYTIDIRFNQPRQSSPKWRQPSKELISYTIFRALPCWNSQDW
ncbi:hypothetical protein BDR03DRAFT_975593, partial [Suillus americanus]